MPSQVCMFVVLKTTDEHTVFMEYYAHVYCRIPVHGAFPKWLNAMMNIEHHIKLWVEPDSHPMQANF